jgi:acyl dehydratase
LRQPIASGIVRCESAIEGVAMAIDYEKLINWRFPEIRQTLAKKDCILYALGVGLGDDPLDAAQLRFLLEDRLAALPTMAVVLAYPGFWVKDPATGIDWVRVVHGEQAITLHNPLPVEAELIGTTRITGIVDKGVGKGAVLYSERRISDAATGEVYATLAMSAFCRGDGGFGGPDGPSPRAHPIPERAPDLVCDLPTLPQQALLYRLNGDYNPLHADPAVARAAGFDRPILHGLCTLGVAGHALMRGCCDYDPARMRSLAVRFSAPVFPGETIRTEMWREGSVVSFRARTIERDVVVLNNGRMEIAAS